MNQAYFDTLNESLASENVIDFWPCGSNVAYGETIRHHVEDGSKYGRIVSVYRTNEGRYERAVTYKC